MCISYYYFSEKDGTINWKEENEEAISGSPLRHWNSYDPLFASSWGIWKTVNNLSTEYLSCYYCHLIQAGEITAAISVVVQFVEDGGF